MAAGYVDVSVDGAGGRLRVLPEREEDMVSMTVKLTKSQLARVTAAAKRYHISRSEYVRRRLADA